MEKLNYIVTSAGDTFSNKTFDTDMTFPFTGGRKGSVTQKGREGRTTIIDLNDETWGYITEEEFLEIDNLEYLGFNGRYHVYQEGDDFSYADDDKKEKKEKGEKKERKKFFTETKVGKGLAKAGKGVVSAAKWVASTLWGKRMKDRRENRRKRKSEKQLKKEEETKKKLLAQGAPAAEADKVAKAEGEKVKKQEEAAITKAETDALNQAKSAGKTVEEIEKAANEAGEKVEKEIFGGYTADEDKGFWKSMGVGGKVAIIGGGALLIGLVIYLVVKNK